MDQASFNFMAADTIWGILEPKKIKYVTVSIVSPSICCEVMGPDAMILVFWKLNYKPAFLNGCKKSQKKNTILQHVKMTGNSVLCVYKWGFIGTQPPSSVWVSLVAQMVKNLPTGGRPGFHLCVRKVLWRRKWLPTPVFLPGKSHGQRSLGDISSYMSIPGERLGWRFLLSHLAAAINWKVFCRPGLVLKDVEIPPAVSVKDAPHLCTKSLGSRRKGLWAPSPRLQATEAASETLGSFLPWLRQITAGKAASTAQNFWCSLWTQERGWGVPSLHCTGPWEQSTTLWVKGMGT